MEIERKYLVKQLPENLGKYPHFVIEQGYLCTEPTIRIRRKNNDYILTYKSRQNVSPAVDTCVNVEEEFPLSKEAYEHLKEKTDGILVCKTRYYIPYQNIPLNWISLRRLMIRCGLPRSNSQRQKKRFNFVHHPGLEKM